MSSKNQIVIPKEAREALGLRPGDQLIVQVWEGKLRLTPYPESFTDALKGLGKHLWEGIDVKEYLRKVREGEDL